MRYIWSLTAVVVCAVAIASAAANTLNPSSFATRAKFSVDRNSMSLSSAVATIESRPNAPGHSWLRVNFYSFPLTAEDLADVRNGSTKSMDRKWNKSASNPDIYNDSRAVIQLSVDKNFRVLQVDMSVPGHTCTIVPFEQDVKNFLQNYDSDGKNLKLKSKGSYVCDMKFMGIPNQKFGWDIDVNIPVFEKK